MKLVKIVVTETAGGDVTSIRGVFGHSDTFPLPFGLVTGYQPDINYQVEEQEWHITLQNVEDVAAAKSFLRIL